MFLVAAAIGVPSVRFIVFGGRRRKEAVGFLMSQMARRFGASTLLPRDGVGSVSAGAKRGPIPALIGLRSSTTPYIALETHLQAQGRTRLGL